MGRRHGWSVSACWLLGLLAIAPLARAVDGAWQGSGTQLILTRRGAAVASPALRPLRPPPADAVVTSVNWHIESERPLAAGVRLAICQGGGASFPMDWPGAVWR